MCRRAAKVGPTSHACGLSWASFYAKKDWSTLENHGKPLKTEPPICIFHWSHLGARISGHADCTTCATGKLASCDKKLRPNPPSHVFFLDGCSFFVFPIAQIMSKYEETVATFPTKLQDLIRQFCKARAAGKQTGTTPAVLKNISAFDSGQFLQQMKNFANPSKPTWKRNIHCKNPTGPSIMSKLCMC